MTEQKVYAIALKESGDNEYTRNRLGRKITILSECVKEPVYFHDFKYPTTTSEPLILLECSMDFLKRLKGEFFIDSYSDLGRYPEVETIRSPELQERYKNAAPPPPPSYKNKPKFGP